MSAPVSLEGPSSVTTGRMVAYVTLAASLTASYGALFTIVGDYRDTYGISEATIGWIIGAGFIISFVVQVFASPLGDRGWSRMLVVGGAVINIVGVLGMAFGTTATVLLAGRIVAGAGAGLAAPAIRRIVVVGSNDDVGRNLGRLFSAEVFGFAVGPVISAFLVGPIGLWAPFVVIAVATAAITAYIVVVGVAVPETVQDEATAADDRFSWDLLRLRPFAGAALIGSAAYVMIGGFDALWDVVHSDLGSPDWMSNLGIALFALPLVILGPTSGKLAQRVGPFVVAGIGMMAGATYLGIYGVMASGAAIFWVAMAHAVTDGLSFAASGVAVGMAVPESRQSAAQGLLGGLQSLAAGITAPIIGTLYGRNGQQTAYWTTSGIVFVMAIAGLVLAGPAIRGLRDPD